MFAFAEDYRKFISICKTERECATYIYDLAKAAGFEDLDEAIAAGKTLKAGDKVMANNMGKGLAMFILGEKSLEECVDFLKMQSRRYAKRQLTWFRRDEKINWIQADICENVFETAVSIIQKSEILKEDVL